MHELKTGNQPLSDPRQSTRSDVWPALALLAVSVALSVILCLPILNTPLVSDDWVLLDALVQKGIWGAWGGGGHEMLGFFRPLMTLTLWMNLKIGGLNPFGYHLVNAVIHGIAAWLVGLIVWQFQRILSAQSSVLSPVFASLLFLVHPSHGEPVAWVSSRPDLMACALALGALAVWIISFGQSASANSSLHPASAGVTSHPSLFKPALAGLLFALALLAKESAIVLPLIIFTYEFIFGSRGNFGLRVAHGIRRTWPLFLILIIFLIIRTAALGHAVGGYGSTRILGMNPLLWARNLAVDTLRSLLPAIPSPGFDGWARIGYAAAVIAIAGWVLIAAVYGNYANHGKNGREMRAWPIVIFCLLAFLISIVPVINLPLSMRSSEGERFIYLGSAFMMMALAMTIGRNYKANANILSCLILCVYIIGFERSLSVWREAGRLAGDLVSDFERITSSRQIESVRIDNLPDHLRGAYVFRNGFVEAARLNGVARERIKEITIQNIQAVHSIHDPFIPQPAPAPPGTVSLNYSEGKLKEFGQ